jgi:hypothetical protein
VTRGPVRNNMHGMGPIGSGCKGDATHVGLTGHIFTHVQRAIHLLKRHRLCKSVSDF